VEWLVTVDGSGELVTLGWLTDPPVLTPVALTVPLVEGPGHALALAALEGCTVLAAGTPLPTEAVNVAGGATLVFFLAVDRLACARRACAAVDFGFARLCLAGAGVVALGGATAAVFKAVCCEAR
jgi:hypothetical protein